jgi:hypothetical protein
MLCKVPELGINSGRGGYAVAPCPWDARCWPNTTDANFANPNWSCYAQLEDGIRISKQHILEHLQSIGLGIGGTGVS